MYITGYSIHVSVFENISNDHSRDSDHIPPSHLNTVKPDLYRIKYVTFINSVCSFEVVLVVILGLRYTACF